MKKIFRNIFGTVCSAALLLSSNLSAYALDNGIYLADSTSYYAHPYTGVIEDSGGECSSVLGQSMTESALCPQALIEVDPNGYVYATVRLSLMDNIENPQFMVQENADCPFYDVSADCMQENLDANTSDFRFQIPSENCIVRSTFYVVPMGRDVIFYIGFSNLTEGCGDFITSVEVLQPTEPEEPVQTEIPTEAATVKTTTLAETTTFASETTIASTASAATETATAIIPKEAEITAKGIVMFDENGTEIKELSAQNTDSEKTENGNMAGIVVAVIAGIAVVGGVVIAVIRKRSGNN